MASSDRRIKDFPRAKRPDSKLAAVMILLYPVDGQLHTLFIQRPDYDGVHGGQISFPGGKKEKEDEDLIATALRETHEETGAGGEDFEMLGKLTPLFIPVSNIEVTPFIAYCSSKPDFVPCDDEVVFLIEARLSVFLNGSIVKERPMNIRNDMLKVRYYDYEGNVIWGATAMILHELLTIIRNLFV